MNRDDIIRMAREHLVKSEYTEFGWQECHRYEFDDDELLHFAAIVAAAEREACAAIAEMPKYLNETGILTVNPAKSAAAHFIAIAIRARGEVPR